MVFATNILRKPSSGLLLLCELRGLMQPQPVRRQLSNNIMTLFWEALLA